MKIGILTFHRAHNYGAVLQCYALQEYIRQLGHNATVIDYRQKYIDDLYSPLSCFHDLPKCSLRSILAFLQRFMVSVTKSYRFYKFRKRFLNLSNPVTHVIPTNYDIYIIGSDQMWSMQCTGGSFDPIYMGDFDINDYSKKVGYAISSNTDSILALKNPVCISKLEERFSFISLRESAYVELLLQTAKKKISQCVDPTLLTNKNLWYPLLNNKWKNKKYIAVYSVRGNKNLDFSLEVVAKRLSREIGCEIIVISASRHSVSDFVSIIANAKYVVTTSFHATVFSLIFHVPFATYALEDGNDMRYTDLLMKLGLEKCIYSVEQLPKYPLDIVWNNVEQCLDDVCSDSILFLKQALS